MVSCSFVHLSCVIFLFGVSSHPYILEMIFPLVSTITACLQWCNNPRRACAARVTVVCVCVCVCVCVSTLILALQATKRPISDIISFRITRARKIKGRFSWNDCVRERQTGTVADRVPWPNPSKSGAHAYIRRWLTPTWSDPLALCISCTAHAQFAEGLHFIRLLHMVVVSWGDKQWRPIWVPCKARVTPRRLSLVAPRANHATAS